LVFNLELIRIQFLLNKTVGKWYYLNQSGTMEHDKYIDGYYVGSNGAWVE
jgi:glucan-binding YG repeat protein